MPTTLPWYNHCYAARFPVLLEGVGKLFSGTFDAIYSDTQTDTLAVFLSCTVLALVAALFFTLWHNTKKLGIFMVKFLVTSVVVLICLFLMALLLCLMVWVITRLLRFLFPQRFRSQAPTKKKKKKPSPAVTEEDEE